MGSHKKSRRSSTSSSDSSSDGGAKKQKRGRPESASKKLLKRKLSSSSSSDSSSSGTSSTSSSSDSEEERRRLRRQKKLKSPNKKSKKQDAPDPEDASTDIPLDLMTKSKAMAPMTKEEWEKRQSVVRRVYDEGSGRHRLIKGDGEVIEEIVSRDRHKAINQQATKGDGDFFQAQLAGRSKK